MLQLIIAVGAVLLIAILLAIFRITRLLRIAKGTSREQVDEVGNSWNAIMMLVFLVGTFGLMFWYSYTYFDDYTLPVASTQGVITDNLFWVTMAVTGVVFIITHILLFWFAYRYQYKKNTYAHFYPHNNFIEIVWTIIPAIVLTLLVFTGLKAWTDITAKAPDDSEVLEIMGYQFAWRTRYPGKDGNLGSYDFRLINVDNEFGMDLSDKASFDDFMPREIHIPNNQPIHFKIRARDVLHSVFAPHFRMKMDAVPGMPTSFWFTPTKTTEEMRAETGNPNFNYEIACTEICGRGHFSMKMIIVVEERAAYDKWYGEQEAWLKKNPSYLSKVPADLKDLASQSAGINNFQKQDVAAEPAPGSSL